MSTEYTKSPGLEMPPPFQELNKEEFDKLSPLERYQYIQQGRKQEKFNHPLEGQLYEGKETEMEGNSDPNKKFQWHFNRNAPAPGWVRVEVQEPADIRGKAMKSIEQEALQRRFPET